MNKNKIASVAMVLMSSASFQVYAASTNMQFNGTVSSVCAFTSVNNGILGVAAATPNILSTNPNGGGTQGSVNIAYNSTPTVTVNNITQFTSSPNISGITNSSFGMFVTGQSSGPFTWGNNVFTKTYSSGTSDAITIDFEAQTGNSQLAWPTGSYSATTTITCQ